MDQYTVLGMVCSAIIALFTFLLAQKRAYKESLVKDIKEIQALNENLIKLNINFEHMLKEDAQRDENIRNQGHEIDLVKDRVTEVEHKQIHYETKLQDFENQLYHAYKGEA